ncbi:STT3 domain-containing protein [Halostella sp. PRR32]|uniref:STT3 domain-containing protein n=1 Tax=Halostella sp. PRR32 TaxID=3098147 RepID=UPI002B1E02AA|nr:STT3 domain-containing protein [Halostella sp. PRR32]
MTAPREEISDLLAGRPEFESALREILDVDERRETWTFDDVSADSGTFGELVSRDVVERVGDEYRLADPPAVRTALDGESPPGDSHRSESASAGDRATAGTNAAANGRGVADELSRLRERLPSPSRNTVVGIVAALALVAAFRLVAYPSVFRDGDIVLLANDPYFYRYWLLELVADGAGPFAVPEGVLNGEPLLVAVLWTATLAVGGDARAVDLVLAWYPVVAALVTGLAVYGATVRLTDDARIGLAATGLLAVMPIHAYRSAVGFGDHHAFDYMIVAVSLYALVGLASVDRDLSPRSLTARAAPWTVLLGGALAAQVLAWNAGPLLILPAGLYLLARSLLELRAGRSPLRGVAPTLAAAGLAAALVWAAHGGWQWQAGYVALTPVFLFGGGLAAALVGEASHRAGLSWKAASGTLTAASVGVFAVAWTQFPEFATEFREETERLALKAGQSEIVETASLFDADLGGPFAPIFYFGLVLFLALPYAVWGVWVAGSRDRPDWLAASTFVGLLLVLGTLQVRFAGALAVPVAVFAGVGFVHLASVVDLARRPACLSGSDDTDNHRSDFGENRNDASRSTVQIGNVDGRSLGLLLALTVLIAGLGAFLTPPLTNDLTVESESYQAATWIQGDAAERGLAENERYVFSQWDRNRMYNAFASGDSRSYWFARSNYDGFLAATNGTEWYERLDGRVQYVVTADRTIGDSVSEDAMYYRLHEEYGVDTDHYRAVYATDDGTRKVFTLVSGATVTGPTSSNDTVNISRTEDVDLGETSVDYERTAAVENGTFSVVVTQPGEYSAGGQTVTVSEAAVVNGTAVEVSENSTT